jgi:hypothetical protein
MWVFEDPPGLSALKSLDAIATAERRKPGRNLLPWVAPGWVSKSGTYPLGRVVVSRQLDGKRGACGFTVRESPFRRPLAEDICTSVAKEIRSDPCL